jgi:ABC-type multidrug transport system fused ATPase/permease subunit
MTRTRKKKEPTLFQTFIKDILRDKDSDKFGITKTIALLSFILLAIIIVIGLYTMVSNKEVDHFLVGELMFFILTLLGFKNLNRLGYKENKKVE